MESTTFSIRIKKDILAWIKEKAEKERRSTNNYIQIVLADHVKKTGK